MRHHLGLAHSKFSSLSKIPLPQKPLSECQVTNSNLILANESVYSSLLDKKRQIFKSFQKEEKSQSTLRKDRDSLTQKLLVNLNRNFNKDHDKKGSKLLDFYESRKKILTMYEGIENFPISFFHLKNFDLRINEDYKINTPKLCLHPIGYNCKTALKNISFTTVFDYLSLNKKLGEITKNNFAEIFECDKNIFSRLKMFVYDEKTAIPYVIINSKVNNPDFQKQILFILHDIFENFLEHFNYYQNMLIKIRNCSIVLMNYPGQMFSIYDRNYSSNNEDISKILDAFIFYLDKQGTIELELDRIKLIGFGFGGNVGAYFASSCEGAFLNLHSIMLINTYVYIDEMLKDKLIQLLNIFESSIGDELAMTYYFQMTQTSQVDNKQVQNKLRKNPLDNQTKKHILKGCINNVNCQLNIQKFETLIFVVHSLQNSFISIIHADILNKINSNLRNSFLKIPFNENKILNNYDASSNERKAIYIDGGHDLIEVEILKTFYLS